MKHNRLFTALVRLGVRLHVALFRLTGGRLLGRNTILLTTRGARTGRLHTVALVSLRVGGDHVVVGSWGGSDTDPHWFRNLRANPRVILETGPDRIAAVATEITERATYDELWQRLVLLNGVYRTYRERTTRHLPIVRISPLWTNDAHGKRVPMRRRD
jgi:deazaflavin-dependent oxidoreductase (nitroreductase family)